MWFFNITNSILKRIKQAFANNELDRDFALNNAKFQKKSVNDLVTTTRINIICRYPYSNNGNVIVCCSKLLCPFGNNAFVSSCLYFQAACYNLGAYTIQSPPLPNKV